nr:E3 ubiquitin-protein ligase TRIM7-like isoform X1 [Chrysemys picta bellii]
MAGAGSAARRLLQPCSPRGVAVGPGAARSGRRRHGWGGHAPAGRGRARLPGLPPAREVPKKHLAPLGKEREAAKAEEERQSEELPKQTEAERQKIIWEWQELRGFLEGQEQWMLSRWKS